jgi:hypothetical protein
MMTGVADEADRLIAGMDTDGREAELVAARKVLEERLYQAVWDGINAMKDEVSRQSAALLSRDSDALAAVDSDRQDMEAAIDALRTQTLWDIKEAVWKLGYTSGYKFGGHDGKDAELLAEITALRDAYQAAIDDTIGDMIDRVAREKEEAEAAYLAAQGELDALQESERLALEDAISVANADMEAAFTAGSDDCAADAQAAKEAL